jgi:hypothetical protein
MNSLLKFVVLIIFSFLLHDFAQAQQRSVPQSQQFRLGEGLVRIAEPGQLSDTLSVWGDINAPGRYLVPRGTRAHELISYARGPISVRTGETILDWSALRLDVTISRYDDERGMEVVQNYSFRYNEPFPEGLRQYELQNDEIISLEIKRRPAFVDYVRVIAPVVSTVATTLLIIDRL